LGPNTTYQYQKPPFKQAHFFTPKLLAEVYLGKLGNTLYIVMDKNFPDYESRNAKIELAGNTIGRF